MSKEPVNIQLSIIPNSVPFTPEQLAKLPVTPDDYTRSYLFYNGKAERNKVLGELDFMFTEDMKKEFEEAFGYGFEATLTVFAEGGDVHIDRWDLECLSKFGAALYVNPHK